MALTYTNQTGDIAWKQRVVAYAPGQHPLNTKLSRQQILEAAGVRRPDVQETPDDLVNAPAFDRCRELGHEIRARRDEAMKTIRYSHSTDDGMYLFELTYLAAAQHPRSLAGALADWLAELPGHGTFDEAVRALVAPDPADDAQVYLDTLMGSSSVQNWVYEQGVARLIDPDGVTHFVMDLPPGQTVHIPQLGGQTWTLTATSGGLDVSLE